LTDATVGAAAKVTRLSGSARACSTAATKAGIMGGAHKDYFAAIHTVNSIEHKQKRFKNSKSRAAHHGDESAQRRITELNEIAAPI